MVEALAETWAVRGYMLEVYHGLVRRLVKSFEGVGLEYMFTGGLAASFYGVPRTTTDVDVVVEVADGGLESRLVSALESACLVVDRREIVKALKSDYRIARFRDTKTSYCVDVIFSSGKIAKRAGTIAGLNTFFQAPEDLVLAKLRMIKATVPRERALKDVEDVRAILKFTEVDVGAVRKQARKNNTLSLFEAIIDEANL